MSSRVLQKKKFLNPSHKPQKYSFPHKKIKDKCLTLSQLELSGQKTCLCSFWLIAKKSCDPTLSIRVKSLRYVHNTPFCWGWITQCTVLCSSKGHKKHLNISRSKPMALLRFISPLISILVLMQLTNCASVHFTDWLNYTQKLPSFSHLIYNPSYCH